MAARERLFEHCGAASREVGVDLVQPILECTRLVDARPRQLEQPSQVLGRDEVPGRSKDVRPEDLAGVECSIELGIRGAVDPLADRPLRAGVVLRLDREELPDRRRGRREALADKPLSRQPANRDGYVQIQPGSSRFSRARRGP
jgi:hypothetical protein